MLHKQALRGIPTLMEVGARTAIRRELRASADARVQRAHAELARAERGRGLIHVPHLSWGHQRDGKGRHPHLTRQIGSGSRQSRLEMAGVGRNLQDTPGFAQPSRRVDRQAGGI